jgi:hypothetical protein
MATKFENNIVVSRRLAIAEKLTKAQVKAYVDGKTSLEDIAETLGESVTRAQYGVKQAAVEYGLVPTLSIDTESEKAIREVHGGEHADWAWLACRLGVTPQSLQKVMRNEEPQPKSSAAQKSEKPASRARRGGKQSK